MENQERPLLFFVNQGRLAEPPDEQRQQIHDLRHALACRGDRAYLAIIRPGTLNVIPVSLKDQTPDWKTFTIKGDTPEAITFFSRLVLGTFEELPTGGEVDYLFKEIFTLVDKTATRLGKLPTKRNDVISLHFDVHIQKLALRAAIFQAAAHHLPGGGQPQCQTKQHVLIHPSAYHADLFVATCAAHSGQRSPCSWA